MSKIKTPTFRSRLNNIYIYDNGGLLSGSPLSYNPMDIEELNRQLQDKKNEINNNSNSSLESINTNNINSILNGVSNIASNINENLKSDNNYKIEKSDNLLDQLNSYQPVKLSKNNVAGSTISGVTSGATAGSSFGPIGIGVGAAVGGLGSLISGIFGNKKKRNQERRINSENINKLNMGLQTEESNYLSNRASNVFAYGGNFDNGVNEFNSGHLHEESPIGGIPQGINQNGEPNLVEKDEVKYNDYIYSNRLKPDELYLEALNLPKSFKNKTYAQAAKIISKESKERPYDIISKKGLDDAMSKLMISQELLKQNNDIKNQFAEGGDLNNKSSIAKLLQNKFDEKQKGTIREDSQKIAAKKILESINTKYNDNNSNNKDVDYDPSEYFKDIYERFGISNDNNNIDEKIVTNTDNRAKVQERKNTSINSNQNKNIDSNNRIEKLIETNPIDSKAQYLDTENPILPLDKIGDKIKLTKNDYIEPELEPKNKNNLGLDSLRYLSPINNLAQTIALSREDPTEYPISRINPQLIGDYMNYDPSDREYLANQVRSQSAGNRDALMNTSGGNRAALSASLLSQGYNDQKALSNAYIQADEMNLNKLLQAKNFNKQTNMFNAQAKSRADMFNKEAEYRAFDTNERNKAALRSAKSQALNSLFNDLSNIGYEERNMNTIESMPFDYTMNRDGSVSHKKACGGKLKNRRK